MSEPKLKDTISIKIDDKAYEIFMSYALKIKLVEMTQEASDVSSLMSNPTLQMDVLKEVLARRREDGEIVGDPIDFENAKFSDEDLYEVLTWIVEHVLSFFAQGLDRTLKMVDQAKQAADQLDSEQSKTGSKD